jgi:hypothetical protein
MDREYIVAEIRRLAAEKGGRPPGAPRFATETGIRAAAWRGKFWARWGDALREAGFAPNELQQRYDPPFLLQSFAALTHELGRVPVYAELEMKARQAPGFPWSKAFRRLGDKPTLIAKVIDHCQTAGGYDDVVAICRRELGDHYRPTTSPSRVKAVPIGFVYLLKAGRHYKIGHTNAVGRRARELAIQLPEKANVVHQIATDDPAGIEAYWHERFKSKRGNGEWFALSPDDIAAFRRRRTM